MGKKDLYGKILKKNVSAEVHVVLAIQIYKYIFFQLTADKPALIAFAWNENKALFLKKVNLQDTQSRVLYLSYRANQPRRI